MNTVPPTPPPSPPPAPPPGPEPEPRRPQDGYPAPQPPYPPAVATADERNWALMAHLLSFVAAWFAFGFLAPLIVMLTKGNQSAYIRHHAVESLNFQLTALIAGIVSGVLIFVVIGLLLLPIVAVVYVVFVILASIAANRGEWYRYPVTIRFIS